MSETVSKPLNICKCGHFLSKHALEKEEGTSGYRECMVAMSGSPWGGPHCPCTGYEEKW